MNSRSHVCAGHFAVARDYGATAAAAAAAAGRRRRNRVVNFGLALVLGLVSAVAGASPAAAYSVPWVPPSWGTGSAPTWLGGTAVGGGGWGLVANEGSGYGKDCTAIPNKLGRPADFGLSSTFPGGSANLVARYLIVGSCPGYGMTETGNYTNPTLWATCDGTNFQAATGRGSVASGSYYYAGYVSCSIGIEADVMIATRGAVSPSAAYWQPGTGRIGGTQVLRLMCSNGDGVQVVSGEAGSSDVSVSCPAGYAVIGGSLEVGGTVVSQVSAPVDVTPAQQHAVSTGAGRAVIESGGYSCDPTMALGSPIEWCRRYGSDGSAPETAICKFTFDDVSLSMITLTKADCASWREVIGGGSAPTDPSEDGDTNLVIEWLQRIKAAVDGVRGAVESVREAINAAKNAIVEAIEGIEVGGGGQTVQPCTTAACGGLPTGPDGGGLGGAGWADLGAKLAPMTAMWGDLVGAFAVQGSGNCLGPEMPLPEPIGTIYPLSACEEPMKTVAGLTKLLAGVLLVVGAMFVIIRTQSAAWGLNVDVGKGGE